MNKIFLLILCCFNLTYSQTLWEVNSQEEWKKTAKNLDKIEIKEGFANSTDTSSKFTSIIHKYKKKKKAKSIIFKQTTAWDNWKEIPNVGSKEMQDAQVFIPVKENDYWLLARYMPDSITKYKNENKGKKIKDRRPNKEKGYHAWHSTDMINWKRYGPVSNQASRWVTTAEYVDGKFYIYYDNPNDQDPHLIIDDNLYDGKIGNNIGLVFADPTHGSDCAILRDEDESFHLIYENWDHINAKKHSWDSPVGGHAVSKDGITNFKILDPLIDDRTTPTGTFGEYRHSSRKVPLKYEIHSPEQNAYGDWTAIKIGGQYYLFCDYDAVGEKIKVGKWTGSNLTSQFSFCGSFGDGHPDPTIGFAEGQFYLMQQRGDVDFISPGPWVEGVEARLGVDTDGNGVVNEWTKWQVIKEFYTQKKGFLRIVETKPATLDVSKLPKGYGFCFEYKTNSVKSQSVKVKMDQVIMKFK